MIRSVETEIKNLQHYEIVSYDSNIDKLSELKKIADSAYQSNLDFFTKDINGIKVNFIYSDDELREVEKKNGMEFQDWHKNLACKDTVWISSPHIPKGKDCQRSVTHEFAHIFTNKLFYGGNPTWLMEGIANVVANRYASGVFKSNIKLEKAHTGLDFQKHPIYDKSTVFTRYLINKFGKDKLFLFLSSVKEKKGEWSTYTDFTRFFNKIYNSNFEKIEQDFMEQCTI
jgi:hypothetical protein